MHRCLILLALATLAADWPRFRGPNGTGIADDALPTTFKEGDGILWKVPLPGHGNSSPVIVGGRIFLQTAIDGGERQLLCLDAKDGHTLWARSAVGNSVKKHQKNSFASSTPAVDGNRVFVLFWDGDREALHAYDTDGTLKWKKDLGPFKSQHGCGASPVAYNGKVLLNHDQDNAAVLIAYAADDGRELWHADRKGHNACYSSPMVRPLAAGKLEVVLFTTTAVSGYDLESGKVNWDWKWEWPGGGEMLRTVASPVMWKDVVFAHAGNGGGSSRTVAVKAGASPKAVWEKTQKGGFPYVPCMLVRDDTLFTVTDKGLAGCYDPKDGKELWTRRLGGGFSASPLIAGGQVYAVNEEGVVYVYPATRKEPASVQRNPLGELVYASPAVADGRLYLRGEKHLFCIGK